ncbi:MAG: NYN domain-containing protein [Cyanobacteria bacterium P01_F01_bin.150]
MQDSNLKAKDRVAIFVDGANLFYAESTLGIQINHRNFLQYIVAQRSLAGAFFYTGFNSSRPSERKALARKKSEGYKVITKKVIRRADGSKKANLDVEMTVDMLREVSDGTFGTLILVSGDGDFTYAVETIKSKGVRVEVIGLKSMTSRTLIRSADRFTNLANIQSNIGHNHYLNSTVSQLLQYQPVRQLA